MKFSILLARKCHFLVVFVAMVLLDCFIRVHYQRRRQEGGLDGSDEPHQILQPWSSPVATCPLALLCTTLEGHITLMLNHYKAFYCIT